MRPMPAAIMSAAAAGVTRVPLGAITGRSPALRAAAAMTKMSGRSSGSPPVRMRIGLPVAAIRPTSSRHSDVESSPSYGPCSAEARQWAQARLQLRVTSQATTRGALASSAARRRGSRAATSAAGWPPSPAAGPASETP